MAIGDFIRNSQVWKSIFRHPAPRDRRNRVVVMLTNVFLHLHPVSVRKSGIGLSYTWCMGGLTFFMFLELTVTGVLLMFYYRRRSNTPTTTSCSCETWPPSASFASCTAGARTPW